MKLKVEFRLMVSFTMQMVRFRIHKLVNLLRINPASSSRKRAIRDIKNQRKLTAIFILQVRLDVKETMAWLTKKMVLFGIQQVPKWRTHQKSITAEFNLRPTPPLRIMIVNTKMYPHHPFYHTICKPSIMVTLRSNTMPKECVLSAFPRFQFLEMSQAE